MEVHETGTVTPGHSRHLSHRSPKARPLSSARVCSSASPVQQHSPAQRMASAPCSRLGAKAPLRESVSAPVLKAVPAPWHPAPCPAPRIVEHRRQWECHATKAKGFGDPSKLQKPKPVVQQPTEVDRCPCESKKSYKASKQCTALRHTDAHAQQLSSVGQSACGGPLCRAQKPVSGPLRRGVWARNSRWESFTKFLLVSVLAELLSASPRRHLGAPDTRGSRQSALRRVRPQPALIQ